MSSAAPVYILEGARTAVGSFGGAFASVPAHELGAAAVGEAVRRAGLTVADVDEFIIGCVGQVGPDAFVARRVALAAGARESSTAMTVNRLCGSGLQAAASAALELREGDSAIVVAGGAENMSRQPFMDFDARNGYRLGHHQLVDGTLSLVTDPWGRYPMGRTAENVATRFSIRREDQDRFAAESQRRAAEAIDQGLVAAEVVPVTVRQRKSTFDVTEDEHPRATTVEALAELRPAFSEDGTVTAGNSSGINDAGAALVLASADAVEQRSLTPIAELVAFAKVGLAPDIMGYAPVAAIQKVLDKAALTLDDIGWIELNEAFASQALAVQRDARLDPSLVNPLGGAIAWGHPIGATGTILALRTIYNIRRLGREYGLITMCIGGGQGVAAIVRAV
ncbi:thiolase family protein [Microbacterium trichothecenolyticum]|uniref:Probable acetyl-CoA acetyltransferase n=1 Tax=Microbacterium ureisolvens TaxID=2781186 RepID=A0ABS7HYK5_9MICO|nr:MULTISPECIES: thiolase family protein [Microbacterium]MBW9110467.1 thiolase family protein [Microbacterium ureisolvens]MBW9120572.1 thiolase family protein [Microbacterium trichothecenolyticum]